VVSEEAVVAYFTVKSEKLQERQIKTQPEQPVH
jgi:hypothetical protein